MNTANIPEEAEGFFDLLEERRVAYLLVGAVALLAHVPGRNTEDIDLVISLSEQERLAPEVAVLDRDGFFARARFRTLQVDFLDAENSLFSEVAEKYSATRHFDFLSERRAIPCATPAGLMLLKLYALPSLYRQGQIQRAKLYEGDIGALLAAFAEMDVEPLFVSLLRHGMLESDTIELRRVVTEQRPQPDRFSD
ncbi:MAG: hypothetical protein ABI946_02165 [Chthoniobacterales bacterium]